MFLLPEMSQRAIQVPRLTVPIVLTYSKKVTYVAPLAEYAVARTLRPLPGNNFLKLPPCQNSYANFPAG